MGRPHRAPCFVPTKTADFLNGRLTMLASSALTEQTDQDLQHLVNVTPPRLPACKTGAKVQLAHAHTCNKGQNCKVQARA